MFYYLLYPLSKYFILFNLFKYITFRSGASFITSFFLIFVLWRYTKNKFRRLKIEEKPDMYGHIHLQALHETKKGTPTMGGVLIVATVCVSTLLWAKVGVNFIGYSLLIMVLFALLGLRDDLLKIKRGQGLARREKLLCQIAIGVSVGLIICLDKSISTRIDLPFFKKLTYDLGYFYIFWSVLVIVATSNAVNFTDGLDGLAMGGIVTNSLVFAILSYISGHIAFSKYLFIPYIKDAGELTIMCASLLGAGLGFLWFNSYPAEIFMGDTGALSLGGVIGVIALFIKKEFLLIISGGLFVLEALSVVLQILSVKLRGKRLFKAAPLHHHFQLLGWPESKIIVRFWIISIMLGVLSLLTLKLR
jgi:phospho-N-acetylmuramoyl-pentapeptide-transferase